MERKIPRLDLVLEVLAVFLPFVEDFLRDLPFKSLRLALSALAFCLLLPRRLRAAAARFAALAPLLTRLRVRLAGVFVPRFFFEAAFFFGEDLGLALDAGRFFGAAFFTGFFLLAFRFAAGFLLLTAFFFAIANTLS